MKRAELLLFVEYQARHHASFAHCGFPTEASQVQWPTGSSRVGDGPWAEYGPTFITVEGEKLRWAKLFEEVLDMRAEDTLAAARRDLAVAVRGAGFAAFCLDNESRLLNDPTHPAYRTIPAKVSKTWVPGAYTGFGTREHVYEEAARNIENCVAHYRRGVVLLAEIAEGPGGQLQLGLAA